jgi:hypothetical protein
VYLLGGVGCEAPYLVFDFPDENLFLDDRRGGDGGFDVIYLLEVFEIKWSTSIMEKQFGERMEV